MGRITPKGDAGDFAERLNQVLGTAKGAPKDKRGAWLGRLLGVSKMTAGDWIRGDYMPEPPKVLAMCDRWKVSFMWLYFGRGSMNDSSAALSSSDEAGSASPTVRLDTLTLAIEVTAELLAGETPTPAQQARYAALCYGLLEQGMARAEVLVFARRLSGVITGEPHATNGNHH